MAKTKANKKITAKPVSPGTRTSASAVSGRTRKPLTDAQRKRKNRLARIRRAKRRNLTRLAASDATSSVSGVSSHSGKPVKRAQTAQPVRKLPNLSAQLSSCQSAVSAVSAVSADADIFQGFRHLLETAFRVFSSVNAPTSSATSVQVRTNAVPASSRFESVEPGVVRRTLRAPDGSRITILVVDGERVNPLSPYSPLPEDMRRRLVRKMLERDIRAIVDARTDQLFGDLAE